MTFFLFPVCGRRVLAVCLVAAAVRGLSLLNEERPCGIARHAAPNAALAPSLPGSLPEQAAKLRRVSLPLLLMKAPGCSTQSPLCVGLRSPRRPAAAALRGTEAGTTQPPSSTRSGRKESLSPLRSRQSAHGRGALVCARSLPSIAAAGRWPLQGDRECRSFENHVLIKKLKVVRNRNK